MGRVMSAKERAELKRLARAGVVVESAPCGGCDEKKRKPKVAVAKVIDDDKEEAIEENADLPQLDEE